MMETLRKFIFVTVVMTGVVAIYFIFFHSSPRKTFLGEWSAKWKTSPESFAGIDSFTSFEMDGTFIFSKDSVTVIAMGFPGCVFGVDTLSHTQEWSLSSGRDTLNLISEGGLIGISYKVNGLSDQYVELQLLEDIFISLEKIEN